VHPWTPAQMHAMVLNNPSRYALALPYLALPYLTSLPYLTIPYLTLPLPYQACSRRDPHTRDRCAAAKSTVGLLTMICFGKPFFVFLLLVYTLTNFIIAIQFVPTQTRM
jgi:hypothetical protein